MTLILAANYAEGKTFASDHRFKESDIVIIFDLVDLPVIDTYEFQSLFVTNGFLSKPKLQPLWERGISRLRLPKRQDI